MQLRHNNRLMLAILLPLFLFSLMADFEFTRMYTDTFTPKYDPAIMPLYALGVIIYGFITLVFFLLQFIYTRRLSKLNDYLLSLRIPYKDLTFKSALICLFHLLILFYVFYYYSISQIIDFEFVPASAISMILATVYTYLLMNLTIRGSTKRKDGVIE